LLRRTIDQVNERELARVARGINKGMKDTLITGRTTEEEIGTRTTITRRKHHTPTVANITQGEKNTPIWAALEDPLITEYWYTQGSDHQLLEIALIAKERQ
jgi:hypothetical protein